MIPGHDALSHWPKDQYGHYYNYMSSNGQLLEVRFEPLFTKDQYYIGVYMNQNLVLPKVVVDIWEPPEGEDNAF